MNVIFSDDILSHYINEFLLSSVTDIRGKCLRIEALIAELDTGKIDSLKEEEFKSRFLNQFFGDVLGFSYGNSNYWMLREEKKSMTDGTKPDAVLGYFQIDKSNDDVRAVIEIKDAKTDLDKNQNRKARQSPVDQAFAYVPRMGGTCKWVIVSNIKEIRFYHALNKASYQMFNLKDLVNESKLKELIYLFHKDRFIKRTGKSNTDALFERKVSNLSKDNKPIHIIDKIYNSLKKFEGFGFVDPNYITAIYPFNILQDHVWHYNNGNLFTINNEIHDFLGRINVINNEVIFDDDFKMEIINLKVIEAKQKVEWAFNYLNNCLINEISAVKDYQKVVEKNGKTIGFSRRMRFHFQEEEGLTKSIQIHNGEACDCLSCNYRSLDFNNFLSKLKVGNGNEKFYNAEYAFGNYLVASDNFKTSYSIYKQIEKEAKGKQGKGIEYFLAKLNLRHLHNLMLDYRHSDRKEIMSDIKTVDLDKVIYNEIEFDVDADVKNYLLEVKEDTLIYKMQDEIDELISSIEKYRIRYKDGFQGEHHGPNLAQNLSSKYYLVYLHINRNFLVYDVFKRYKLIVAKTFRGLVKSYQTPKIGLQIFNDFFLTEAILHIYPRELQDILNDIDSLKTSPKCIGELLKKLNNLISSYYIDGLFNTPLKNTLLTEQINYHRFHDRFTDIFTNLFTVLSRIDVENYQFRNCSMSLIKFLRIEDELAWHDLEELAKFIYKKGELFELSELVEILKISINRDEYIINKYDKLIEAISRTLIRFYPNNKIDNPHLLRIALSKCVSDMGDSVRYNHLVNLANACADSCKQILFSTFKEHLDERFDADLYQNLIWATDFNFDEHNYFESYSKYVNTYRGDGTFKYGKNELTDIMFMNYVSLIYQLKIDFNRTELKLHTKLNDFESWLLNPLDFNYGKFDAKWLTDLSTQTHILKALSNHKQISNAIEVELKSNFNPILAEIKYKYFIQASVHENPSKSLL